MGRRRTRAQSPDALPKVDPLALEPADKVLQIRLTASELEKIRETASSLNLTMTAYLLGLHEQAVAALEKKGGPRHR